MLIEAHSCKLLQELTHSIEGIKWNSWQRQISIEDT